MRYISVILLSLIIQAIYAGEAIDFISNQTQFDKAIARIREGDEMHLYISKGHYSLNNPVSVNSSLYIVGNEVTINYFNHKYEKDDAFKETNEFLIYKLSEPITPYSLFYDERGNLLKVSESVNEEVSVNYVDGFIIGSESMKAGNIVMIPIPNEMLHLQNKRYAKAFGYFDCGWQTINFLLERSDRTYFYCKTLNDCRTGNYSYDLKSFKKGIRFVLYNAEQKPDGIYYDNEYLYVPQKYSRVFQVNCTNYDKTTPDIIIKSDISISGVTFVGLNGIEISTSSSRICEIRNCHFMNGLGTALKIVRNPGGGQINEAIINNCTFTDCSQLTGNCIAIESINNENNYFVVSGCKISRYSDSKVKYKNPNGGIWVYGNAKLIGNLVCNTPRCHLYFNKGRIVAKGNVLYNCDEFNSHGERNFGEDWGLVYCNHMYNDTEEALNNTLKHNILLENNLLYGAYGYVAYARGIYIDDGRGDVVCKNNIILNTQFFSIDSRNVKLTDASSVRNRYEGNIISSNYKLVAGPAVRGSNIPVTKANVVLVDDENVTSGINAQSKDTRLNLDTKSYFKNGKLYVSREVYRIIKKSPTWRYVKNIIKRQ